MADLIVAQAEALARASGAEPELVAQYGRLQRRLVASARAARDSADAARRFTAVVDSAAAEIGPGAGDVMRRNLLAERGVFTSAAYRDLLAADPVPALRRVRVPVLALNGTLDRQVPAAENLAGIGAALAAAGNRDHTETALPGLNHLFQTARTGLPVEYGAIEETVAPAALDAVTAWVVARFAGARR